MDVYFKASVAVGEFIGSFMLSLGILLTVMVAKKKSFGLSTALKQRGFIAVNFVFLVTISILAAHEFGGKGYINPAIAFIHAFILSSYKGLGYIIGFELLGGILAALIALFVVWSFNKGQKDEKEKVVLSETFKFNAQHPGKVIGYEWLANIFWLLPIAGLLLFTDGGTASVFELAFAAGMGLGVIVLVTNEWAAANLNPQVWLAEFILKFIAQRKITRKELLSEVLSLTQVVAVGIACGAMANGVHKLS